MAERADVEAGVYSFGEIDDWEVDVFGFGPDTEYFQSELASGRWPSAGSREAMLSAGFADRRGHVVGDTITIDLASGPVGYLIVGTADDAGRALYVDRDVLAVDLGVPGGANVIWSSDPAPSLELPVATTVTTADELAAESRAGRDAIVMVFGAIGVIVAGVAALAVISSMTVSLYERRHELAALQAIGARRRRLRGLLVRELVPIGLLGVAGGLALGALGTAASSARSSPATPSTSASSMPPRRSRSSSSAHSRCSCCSPRSSPAASGADRSRSPCEVRHESRDRSDGVVGERFIVGDRRRARDWPGEPAPPPIRPGAPTPPPAGGQPAPPAGASGEGWDWDRARELAETWFRPLAAAEGWRALLFLFASAVAAPFLFAAMVVFGAITFGLLFVVVGFLLIVPFFRLVEALTALERRLASYAGHEIEPRRGRGGQGGRTASDLAGTHRPGPVASGRLRRRQRRTRVPAVRIRELLALARRAGRVR